MYVWSNREPKYVCLCASDETNVYDGISIKRNKRRETKENACRCLVVCENLTICEKNACVHIKSKTLRCDW